MEAVSSTYAYPSATSAYAPRPQLNEANRTGGSGHRTGSSASGGADPQKGFQPSESKVSEFTPYSPTTTQPGRDLLAKPSSSDKQQDAQIQAEVARLKSTEEKVKAHEAAHKSAGGTLTGPISYTYTRGPDGRSYITGGEVPIAISSGKTPQETINRMQQVIQAALAPSDPSPQDRAVAAQAAAQQQQARQDAAESALSTAKDTVPPSGTPEQDRTNAPQSSSDLRHRLVPEDTASSKKSKQVSYYA